MKKSIAMVLATLMAASCLLVGVLQPLILRLPARNRRNKWNRWICPTTIPPA